jgi:hypothetical protein
MTKGFAIAGLAMILTGLARSQDRDKTGTPAFENGPVEQNQRKSQPENGPGNRRTQNANFSRATLALRPPRVVNP